MRLVFLLLVLVGCMPIVATPQHNPLETRVHSVAIVVRLENDKLHHICAGGVIEFRGAKRVVTTAHCLESGLPLLVYANGKTYKTSVIEAKTEWFLDYVILNSEAVNDVPAARVATTELEIGDTVYSWHQPYGISILSRGIYQGRIVPSVPDARDLFFSWEILEMRMVSFDSAQGASGALVFNDRGETVGLVKGGFSTQSRLDSTLIVDIPR